MTAWHALHFGRCFVNAGVQAFRCANRLQGLGSGVIDTGSSRSLAFQMRDSSTQSPNHTEYFSGVSCGIVGREIARLVGNPVSLTAQPKNAGSESHVVQRHNFFNWAAIPASDNLAEGRSVFV